MSRPSVPTPKINPVLQTFRGDSRVSVSLHPLEKALLVITGANLCFTPWALGTMHPWSQFISLGLAIVGFIVSLINRRYTEEHTHANSFRLIMWPKLIRFPIFWLGLVLFAYIATQALNPAWIYATNGGHWWMVPVEHIKWLPAGVMAPFDQMNAWRVLMLYITPWLVACSLWVGFTRRAAVQHLLSLVVANGALLAIIGILERVTGATKILWFINTSVSPTYFFSTIIYKNHAGAYFNLVFMIGAALLYWHFSRSERRVERSSPTPVFAFLCVPIALAVLLTYSRAATLLLIGFLLVTFIAFIIRCISNRGEGRGPLALLILTLVFALFVGLGTYFLHLNRAFDRVGKLIDDGRSDASVNSRLIVRQAGMEMAEGNLVTGWGAGSFRYIFPAYQRHYPEIYRVPWNPSLTFGWNQAHNDYVQLLDELGLIGATLFLAMIACGLRHLWRHDVHRRPHLAFITLALAITMAHAFVDFPTQNPAILLLWSAIAAMLCRWAELENRRDSSSPAHSSQLTNS